jgi:hypothetical protein
LRRAELMLDERRALERKPVAALRRMFAPNFRPTLPNSEERVR